jgi:hypothetical protein
VLRRVTMSHIDQSTSQKGQSKAVPKFVPTKKGLYMNRVIHPHYQTKVIEGPDDVIRETSSLSQVSHAAPLFTSDKQFGRCE